MISGKLLLERYFYDPHHSGLVWDTYPIFRNVPGEDEDGLNFRIGEANKYLNSISPSGRDWKCSLHLTQSQFNALPERYKQSFADKTYLCLYRSTKADLYEVNIEPWHSYGRDVFIWNASADDVKSYYDANGLSHRFRPLSEQERKDVLAASVPSMPGGSNPPQGGGTPVVIGNVPLHYDITLLGFKVGSVDARIEE